VAKKEGDPDLKRNETHLEIRLAAQKIVIIVIRLYSSVSFINHHSLGKLL